MFDKSGILGIATSVLPANYALGVVALEYGVVGGEIELESGAFGDLSQNDLSVSSLEIVLDEEPVGAVFIVAGLTHLDGEGRFFAPPEVVLAIACNHGCVDLLGRAVGVEIPRCRGHHIVAGFGLPLTNEVAAELGSKAFYIVGDASENAVSFDLLLEDGGVALYGCGLRAEREFAPEFHGVIRGVRT